MTQATLHPIEETILGLALKDPENWTTINGNMSNFAWNLSTAGELGEFKDYIPGQEIKFKPNEKARILMSN